jgi:hypothetical protein
MALAIIFFSYLGLDVMTARDSSDDTNCPGCAVVTVILK